MILETDSVKFEFDIKRNITVIQGDSATGKTTLVEILEEYQRSGGNRGIRFQSDVPCVVYVGAENNWKYELDGMKGKIVFFDEDYRFIFTREFAAYLKGADNYFVFITRKPLKELPYSSSEIYGIRTSGKYHFPEQSFHEFYPIYPESFNAGESAKLMILVEDKEAGFRFYENLVSETQCISADGNANVYAKLLELQTVDQVLVIADGAAFGPYIESVVKYSKMKSNVALYFPESFEWLILKSGIIADPGIEKILRTPYDYIDSENYVSWERFFTALLIEKTNSKEYQRYSKTNLPAFYTEGKNRDKILAVMPEAIRRIIGV